MSLKEEIIKIKTKVIGTGTNINDISPVNLDDKVDEFIKWYYENMVKGIYTNIGEFHQPREMRDLIEKVAVWYELRYPKYEINRLMYCCGQEEIHVSDIMFRNNPYINTLLDEDSDAKELDWDEFYNQHAFIKSLPCEERYYFSKAKYQKFIHLKLGLYGTYLYLTNNGIVKTAEDIEEHTNGVIKDKELEGLHAQEVLELFKEKGIELPKNNALEKAINDVVKWNYLREEMLNCIMYRIIERGGNRIGPRRAFLFAKEFGRNIDIPMMYAIDYSDPGLREFINEYLKAGGSKDLVCYVGYFSRASKKEKLDTTTIQELIKTHGKNASNFYTPEEKALHQRLVNALSSTIDQDAIKKEEVQQLRLKRKLEHSKAKHNK